MRKTDCSKPLWRLPPGPLGDARPQRRQRMQVCDSVLAQAPRSLAKGRALSTEPRKHCESQCCSEHSEGIRSGLGRQRAARWAARHGTTDLETLGGVAQWSVHGSGKSESTCALGHRRVKCNQCPDDAAKGAPAQIVVLTNAGSPATPGQAQEAAFTLSPMRSQETAHLESCESCEHCRCVLQCCKPSRT